MHFDATVTLGTVLSAAALVVTIATTYIKGTRWLSEQLTTFKVTLDNHATQLSSHAARMDRYEEHYVELAASLQRLVGRIEGADRRSHVRPPE